MRASKPPTHQPEEKSKTLFKTIARPDHSERILATPPQDCISLNEARMLKAILIEKLPLGCRNGTVQICEANAGRSRKRAGWRDYGANGSNAKPDS